VARTHYASGENGDVTTTFEAMEESISLFSSDFHKRMNAVTTATPRSLLSIPAISVFIGTSTTPL
jgi:hypothetical protein